MTLFAQFLATLGHSARNLLPIVIVVAIFQAFVLSQVPDGLASMVWGLVIVVFGVALFLQGLEMGIFPIGKSLSDDFAAKGSLPWLLVFGFCMGFSTVIAEPALIAVAHQAVPLIAALGLGLAAAIRGRNPLIDGFGLVALAVMVPMITVQLYGILVFSGTENAAAGITSLAPPADEKALPGSASTLLGDLLKMVRDVLPIIVVILFFQFAVIRKRVPHPGRVLFGFVLVIIGLYAFVVGLKLGLFPIGESMAEQLIANDRILFIYLFAFAIGFATTMAEPALIAIGEQAQKAAKGKIDGNTIRLVVAFGVAVGILIGVHRIIAGDSIHIYIIGGYALVIALTTLAPRYIVPLAFDLGGTPKRPSLV
ncbi:MAG: DUF1538 domain-containing protein [Xanthomonadaceae bacterium]|nr:DUF1538 domain-containing protein [Xanthomonadaceae bacterium]